MSEDSIISTSSTATISFLVNQLQKISQDLDHIKTGQKTLDEKLDFIKDTISFLTFGIASLKKEERDTDEKLILAYRYIDRIADKVQIKQSISDYEIIYKGKLTFWDQLDDMTKIFICTAEFLYSSLQHVEKVDFSPVIIEFCRSLENELFLKIFKRYILNFLEKYGEKTQDVLVDDISNEKTRTLAYQIIAAQAGQEITLTLGQMQFFLSKLLKQDINNSFVLEKLFTFIKDNFLINILINPQTVWGLKEIVEKYRNKAAHPDILPTEHVKKCKDSVIKYIELIYMSQILPVN
jgi:hypothetical protein